MDFEPDQDQQAILNVVRSLVMRHCGPERAREVAGGHDDQALDALIAGGFLDLRSNPLASNVAAELVVEEAARQIACANIGIRALVAPAVLGHHVPDRVAVTRRGHRGPIRYGQHSDVMLVVDDDEVTVANVIRANPVDSPYGYPYADVELGGERRLSSGLGPTLTIWWRIAIAAEIVGLVDTALETSIGHLQSRVQFGRPLATLQALQHRLADASVLAEGARWLTRRAAYSGSGEDAATAAAFAAHVAQVVGTETHQLCGAIGFTNEFDLQLSTTRLHGLRLELGGITNHQVAVAQARWG